MKYISYIYIYIIHVNLHINSGMIKNNNYPQFETNKKRTLIHIQVKSSGITFREQNKKRKGKKI